MEKEFTFTMGHRNPMLTSSEMMAYRASRQVVAEKMIGQPFTGVDGVKRGTISNVYVNDDNAFVVSVKCESDDYDIIMTQLNAANERTTSFSIGGTTR